MKTALKVVAGIVIVFGIIIAVVFWQTAGVSDKADEILAQFEAGQVEEVYKNSLLTEDLTFEEFKTAMNIGDPDYDFSKAEKISWNGRGFENDVKYVYGEFKFSNGETNTLTYWFTEENDELILAGITVGAPESENN